MPAIPTLPYPTVETILELTRSKLNDAGTTTGIAGNLFSDDKPYVFPLLNAAYEEVRKELSLRGYLSTKKEIILMNLPPVVVPNAGTQVVINYFGCNNGSTNFANPQLPPDLFQPLYLGERYTGNVTSFCDMQQVVDRLPSRYQYGYLREWQWRQDDGLYFVGSTNAIDIRLEYEAKFPLLVSTSDIVLINGVDETLASWTAAAFVNSRGDAAGAQILFQAGNDAIGRLIAPTNKMKQRRTARRIPYSRARRGNTGGYVY